MGKENRQRGAVTSRSLALILLAGTVTALLFKITHPEDDGLQYRQPGGDFAAQAVRREMIQMFADDGVIAGMAERDTILRLDVGEAFHDLSFKEKQEVASLVCAYWATQNERIRVVQLYDHSTGMMIGVFSPTEGGLKLQ